MSPSLMQILIVVVLVLIFFGRGRISNFMGDLASGIKSFRKGLEDEPNENEIENNDTKDKD
ncbi:MAG: twin-arginine translocase TatA/TatE family subunit [Rhizobiales bacterium TMED94]|jgi:sec-independent protein translocase protein TatA|nr:twin-arginine translocase TatA/TatE family subunit [Rhodobiaceae bacterium]RPF86613.1 MAG: twin-arginine translocase TatA/TatE family subunit [Rhizobiales bacterium TMED94]|tara:strand:- start:1161 stop:1343 length:183 start_codon:yes stop_codon:yes gene_type:complete